MELRQLRTFSTVVRRGSFVRAAEELRYAQSTVTLHVQQLERDFGVELFARNGRATRLTEAGRVLADEADAVLRRAGRLEQTMAELSEGEFGHLRVGSIEPTASLRLPGILTRYCEERPKVRLSVEVGAAETITRKVRAGELDIGVCSPPRTSEGLRFEPLFVEEMALLVPEGHPFVEADTVRVRDLAGSRLLLSERSCAYREEVERALLERGAHPDPEVEIGSIEIGSMAALKEAVRQGLGVALLPEAAITPPPPDTTVRRVEEMDLGLTVGILMPEDPATSSRALEAFVGAVRDALQHAAWNGLRPNPPNWPSGVESRNCVVGLSDSTLRAKVE